jgi:hypothetical protein
MSATFYVSALDQTVTGTTAALFAGAITTQSSAYDGNSMVGTLSTGHVTAFKVYSTEASGSEEDTTANLTGMDKVSTANLFTQTVGQTASGRATYLECQAQNVFGSVEATDFFSNPAAVLVGWEADMASASSEMSLSTSITACEELYNSMMSQVAPRFGMDFGATCWGPAGIYGEPDLAGTQADGSPQTQASEALPVTQLGGSAATCTVELSATNTISRITIVTAGSGYSQTGDITIANGGGTGNDVTILATDITPIHVAFLNGAMDDNTNGVSLPLLSGDIIRCKITITPNNSQQTADDTALSNADSSINYSVYVDYTIA